MPDPELLRRIDVYLDAVPRAAVRTEAVGPFTLFIRDEATGWRYYARPTPGSTAFSREDVDAVRARQRALDQPEALEWVDDLCAGVGSAAEASGMRVSRMPLLHAEPDMLIPIEPPGGIEVRLASPTDDIAMSTAVAMIAFGQPVPAGAATPPDDAAEIARQLDPGGTLFNRLRLTEGHTVLALALEGTTMVGVGSHQPLPDATEITGVAILPSHRRRGIGAAITSVLARDAVARGIGLLCLSAGDDHAARVYERVGFERVGHVGAAEPA